MAVAHNTSELEDLLAAAAAAHDVELLAEPFIAGARSVTVGLLEMDGQLTALPVLQAAATEGEFYDTAAKRDPALRTYHCPADLPAHTTALLAHAAIKAHRALGCDGYSRSDFVVTPGGVVYWLEANSLPGLSRAGNLATMAAAAGIPYDGLVTPHPRHRAASAPLHPMTGFQHQDVPYFAQWASPAGVRAIVEDGADPCDDPLWSEAGFDSEDEYRFWSPRICGLACLESVLAYWAIDVPSRAEMLRAALKWGAYRRVSPDKVEGLTYAPFAEWVTCELGLRAEVHGRLPLAELARHVADASFFIASVSTEIRYPDRGNSRKGGHLVLVHGWDEHGLSFHNPSGIPPYQANAYVDHAKFGRFYAGRGVAIRRSGQDGRI